MSQKKLNNEELETRVQFYKLKAEHLEKQVEKVKLIKSIVQSVYNGGQSYFIFPNGVECGADVGYVVEFFMSVCDNYPELKDIFEGE